MSIFSALNFSLSADSTIRSIAELRVLRSLFGWWIALVQRSRSSIQSVVREENELVGLVADDGSPLLAPYSESG